MPVPTMVDWSNNNGYLTMENIRGIKSRGTKVLLHKVSEGTYFLDRLAKGNIANARRGGLLVGGYHFARFTTEAGARAEARYAIICAHQSGIRKGEPLVLDFEANNLGWQANARNHAAFKAVIEAAGYRYDIYTMGSWTNSMPINNSHRAGWIANYPYNPAGMRLYSDYNAWQFSSTYKFPLVYGGIDVSQLYGTFYLKGASSDKPEKPKKAVYYRYNPVYVYGRTPINRYKDKAFKHAVDHFPAGTVFAIAKVVEYGKITRFQLANGLYITANEENVNRLYYSVDGGVKRVKSVSGSHRFKDVALNKPIDWQPAGTVFDVAKIVKYGDTTRIQLANGLFISGNKKINKFVK